MQLLELQQHLREGPVDNMARRLLHQVEARRKSRPLRPQLPVAAGEEVEPALQDIYSGEAMPCQGVHPH